MASFTLDVQKFADGFIGGSEKAVRGASIVLFSSIIKLTPVDEGRARANWFATGQKPSTKTTTKEDTNGSNTVSSMQSVIVGIQDWSRFTLTNNLPYIEKLEFGGYGDGPKTVSGFSKQAPNGMVRISINRFNQLLEKEAKKSLPK